MKTTPTSAYRSHLLNGRAVPATLTAPLQALLRRTHRVLSLGVRPLLLLTSLSGCWAAGAATTDSTSTAAYYLSNSRVFDRPLMWIGDSPPPDDESQALWDALQAVRTNQWPGCLSVAEDFISAYPQSGWLPSLRSQLAEAYHEAGRDTLALQHWGLAWDATQWSNSGPAKVVADYTLAHWSRLLASLGRYETLVVLRQQNQGRVLDRGPLSQMWDRTGEAVAHMRIRPGMSYRCGTLALYNVARTLNLNFDSRSLLEVPSPTNGFSMATLAQLSAQLNLGLVPVVRQTGTTIPVPSVIHWVQNHYAAIVSQRSNLYRVIDPTFGRFRWMTADVINAEASGNFMVAADDVPQGFAPLSPDQTSLIFGRGLPDFIGDGDDQPCSSCPCPPGGPRANAAAGGTGGSGGSGGGGGGGSCFGCLSFGMATWRVSEPYINIWAEDEPLAYQPPFGRRLALEVSYKQRVENQPFLSGGGSFGNNWGSSWLGAIWVGDYVRYGTFDFTAYYPLGGQYLFDNADGIATNYFNSLKLWAMTNSSGVMTNLELLRSDGSVDVYGFWPTNSDGSKDGYCYLSERISPDGYITTFLYDPYDPSAINVRLRYVVDPNGGTNTVGYPTSGNTNLISQVTDPFGRNASFYYDTSNNNELLTNITDEIGITSSFLYDHNGWLTNLTTPYGVTSFAPIDMSQVQENDVDRSVTITQPDLGHQLYAFVSSPPYEPASFPSSEVPTNTPLGTLDNTPNSDNTYSWGPLQYGGLSTNGSVAEFVGKSV